MTFYQELQLNQAGSKKLICASETKKEKYRHIAVYLFKIILTISFCVVFVTLFSMIFGTENSVAGVVILLANFSPGGSGNPYGSLSGGAHDHFRDTGGGSPGGVRTSPFCRTFRQCGLHPADHGAGLLSGSDVESVHVCAGISSSHGLWCQRTDVSASSGRSGNRRCGSNSDFSEKSQESFL